MMEREEHLEWAKKRALEYLDAGDTQNAFSSMVSDMKKHPELAGHGGLMIGAGMLFVPGWVSNPNELRHWITGFR